MLLNKKTKENDNFLCLHLLTENYRYEIITLIFFSKTCTVHPAWKQCIRINFKIMSSLFVFIWNASFFDVLYLFNIILYGYFMFTLNRLIFSPQCWESSCRFLTHRRSAPMSQILLFNSVRNKIFEVRKRPFTEFRYYSIRTGNRIN